MEALAVVSPGQKPAVVRTRTPFGQSRQDDRGANILARSLYRDLTDTQGLAPEQILKIAGDLISQVTADLKR